MEMRGRSGVGVRLGACPDQDGRCRIRRVTQATCDEAARISDEAAQNVIFGLPRRGRCALLAAHRAPTRNADEGEERPMMMPHSAAPTVKSTGAVAARLRPTWGQHGANMGPTWDQHGTRLGSRSGGAAGPASGSGGEREDDGRLTRRWFLQMTGSSFS